MNDIYQYSENQPFSEKQEQKQENNNASIFPKASSTPFSPAQPASKGESIFADVQATVDDSVATDEVKAWRNAGRDILNDETLEAVYGKDALDFIRAQEVDKAKGLHDLLNGGPLTESQWLEVRRKNAVLYYSAAATKLRKQHIKALGVNYYDGK